VFGQQHYPFNNDSCSSITAFDNPEVIDMSLKKALPNTLSQTQFRSTTFARRNLHNVQIERAEQRFYVSCVLFGSTAREAEFEVLAATPKGAIRITRSFYPRSEKYKVVPAQ
jgi:hypothetical protein